MTIALPRSLHCDTVVVRRNRTVKQLSRRKLPLNRKALVLPKPTTTTPNTTTPYTPVSPDHNTASGGGVRQISLAGAKRSWVELDAELLSYDSDDSYSPPRKIHFATHCAVVEIPHYSCYSPEQKQRLWNGRKLIKKLAKQNIGEYQYDGWKLDAAAEEDSFVTIDGVAMHPSHAAASS